MPTVFLNLVVPILLNLMVREILDVLLRLSSSHFAVAVIAVVRVHFSPISLS
jgi:hypothetical protein